MTPLNFWAAHLLQRLLLAAVYRPILGLDFLSAHVLLVTIRYQDIAKKAIITPFGLFEYLFMPFGLRYTAQTFQFFMDRLFKHLPFMFTYLYDHIFDSRTLEEHCNHLRQFFYHPSGEWLQINPAKCLFAASAVEFPGHRLDRHRARPLQRHLQAISDSPPPLRM